MNRIFKHALCFSLAVVAVLFSSCYGEEDYVTLLNEGDQIPQFSLETSDGVEVVSHREGYPNVITFFNTGCKDCQKELPVLQQLYNEYKDRANFITVSRNEGRESVEAYWKQNGLSMPYCPQQDDALYQKFAEAGVPRIYITNDKGEVFRTFSDAKLPDYATLATTLEACEEKVFDACDSVSVRFQLCVPSATTYSDLYEASNEYVISVLHLYFYDSHTKKFVQHNEVYNLIRREDNKDEDYDISYISEEIKLDKLDYDIFAIANTETAPPALENEEDFLNQQDSSYVMGMLPSIPESGPIMSSRADAHLKVNFKKARMNHTTITFNMERALAKLSIGLKDGCSGTFSLTHKGVKYADVNLTNYLLVNLNPYLYYFQHTAKVSDHNVPENYLLPDNYLVQTAGDGRYVIDPLFQFKSSDMAGLPYCQKKYVSYYGDDTGKYSFASIPAPGNKGVVYILENCTPKDSQKRGYSTGVVFKAGVQPANNVYLYNKALDALVKEDNSEYWPYTLYFYNFKFYGSIKALNMGATLALDPTRESLSSNPYSDEELASYGIKQFHFNMGVYETFYTYWIRHDDNHDNSKMGIMEFGVVRNHEYRLRVAGISGLGSSGRNPDPYLDDEPYSYIDVQH